MIEKLIIPKQQSLQVLSCLKQGLDRKLQGQRDAQDHLVRAYELARDPNPLDAPWPQITAYRLAHLLMREGLQTDWHRVDQLLKEASEGEVLGPVPLIYRLIALSKRNAEDTHTAEMEQVYARARKAMNQVANARLHVGDQRPLQPEGFNLLEAVVYMTGLEYDTIVGWAGTEPFDGLGFGLSGWRIITDADSENLLYPEAIARKAFAAHCEQLDDALAFKVVTVRQISSQRLRRGNGPVGPTPEGHASLNWRATLDLISLVCGRRDHLGRDPASDANDPDAAIRQRKKRLRQELRRLVPELTDEVLNGWWEEPGADRRPPVLPPIILLFGPKPWDEVVRLRRR